MENNTPTDTLLTATPEIVAKMKTLLQQIHDQKDSSDTKAHNQLLDEVDDLYEKYNFADTCFEENGKVGLKDITGTVIIPPVYTAINACTIYGPFDHAVVPAADDSGKYALVTADGTGTPVTPFLYDSINIIPDTLFYVVAKDQKYAIFDADGKNIVPCIIDHLPPYQSRTLTFRSEGKWGIFNGKGLYIPPIYDSMSLDDEYNAPVMAMKDTTWGYIDVYGNFIDIDEYDENNLNAELLYWN